MYIPIVIEEDGTSRHVYDDALADISRLIGPGERERASHVEPEGKLWSVDLSPSGGPKRLGAYPTRGEALEKEVEWLRNNL